MVKVIPALEEWFNRVKDTSNGMFTTETLHFVEGKAQVKWWKQMRTLIVKTIQLKEKYRRQRIFTTACRQLLANRTEVRVILLESVLDDGLIDKLLQLGWTRDRYCENNLLLERTELPKSEEEEKTPAAEGGNIEAPSAEPATSAEIE